jgi:hypothetical protein
MTPGTNGESATLSRRGGRGPKIERVADRYGLTGLGDELTERWTGDSGERESLRTLAEDVNRRLVAAALDAAGVHTVDGEVENYLRILTSDEVTEGTRTEVRKALAAEGVDVERLRADIVSYQSVYNYLVDHRGVTRSDESDEGSPERGLRTIRKLQSRAQTVTATIVDRLVSNDVVSLGRYDVTVDVRVTCLDCDTRFTPTRLFSERRCECGGDSR